MRHFIIILFIFILVFSFFYFLSKPLIIFFATRGLQNIFTGSSVSINRCDFKPAHTISLYGIEIKKESEYTLRINDIHIHYTVISLLKRRILNTRIKGLVLKLDLAQKRILQTKDYLNHGSKGFFSIEAGSISDSVFEIKTSDLNFKASNLIMEFNEDELSLLIFPSDFLDGRLKADLKLTMGKNPKYSLKLNMDKISLSKMITGFKLDKKLSADAKLSGEIDLQGEGFNITVLNGTIFAIEPGGKLSVKDKPLLENISRGSGKSIEFTTGAFTDYQFDEGRLGLSFDSGNLVLSANFEGKQGGRDLNIIVHDFSLKDILNLR